MKRITGQYEQLGQLKYFIPSSLPPKDPSFKFSNELIDLYGKTMQAVGQLNEMAIRLPDTQRFIKAYCIKEAMISSAIEGIHTTLIEIFTQEISDTAEANKETQLVLNYNKALGVALDMTKKQGFPVVSRVILESHLALMVGGDGEKASPGQYRKQQVKVGNLIPAPATKIELLISDLERFINNDSSLPDLIKAGLAHVQFETIHPFLDGNGRIGRLLIVLMLINSGILSDPILYPSFYFKKRHAEYYQRLDAVRTDGDFEGWIYFYLEAIREGALDAHKRAKEIESLEQKLRNKILKDKNFSKIKEVADQTLSILFQLPVISVGELKNKISRSFNSANSIINKLIEAKILVEATKQKRNKLFCFQEYLSLLDKEY
jgi:Fic family protein